MRWDFEDDLGETSGFKGSSTDLFFLEEGVGFFFPRGLRALRSAEFSAFGFNKRSSSLRGCSRERTIDRLGDSVVLLEEDAFLLFFSLGEGERRSDDIDFSVF